VIDTSGDLLVLRRSPSPRAYHFAPLATLHGRFDQPVGIPQVDDAPLWATFHFKRHAAGQIISLLTKPPTLGIEVHTRGAEPQTFRFLPGLAEEQGFLLSPLVADRSAYVALTSGHSPLNVTALKIFVADGAVETYFEEDFTIDVQKLDIRAGR